MKRWEDVLVMSFLTLLAIDIVLLNFMIVYVLIELLT